MAELTLNKHQDANFGKFMNQFQTGQKSAVMAGKAGVMADQKSEEMGQKGGIMQDQEAAAMAGKFEQPMYAGGRGGKVNSKGPFQVETNTPAPYEQKQDMDKMKAAPYDQKDQAQQMGGKYEETSQATGREDVKNTMYMTTEQLMASKKEQADLRYADGPKLTNDQLAQAQRDAGKKVEITRDPALGQRINQMAGQAAGGKFEQADQATMIEMDGKKADENVMPREFQSPPVVVINPPPPPPPVPTPTPDSSTTLMLVAGGIFLLLILIFIAFMVMKRPSAPVAAPVV